jgi:hypothetical protein
MSLVAAVVAVIALSGQRTFSQVDVKPINDLPNPYRRTADWGQLPAGMKWAAVVGAEPGPDGNIYVAHRCFANSCAGRNEPPIFEFDPFGKSDSPEVVAPSADTCGTLLRHAPRWLPGGWLNTSSRRRDSVRET